MKDALAELNQALQNLEADLPAECECRFYYNPITKIGTRLNGSDESEPYVTITRAEYDLMADSVAQRYYLSKSGKVEPIPIAMGTQNLLEYSDTGPYRTLKDCMVFVTPDGPDRYQHREFNYE